MALKVYKFSDPITPIATIPDGTLSTIGGIPIISSDYPDYADEIANSLVWQLENFAGTAAPVNPVHGQLWYDTSPLGGGLKYYNKADYWSNTTYTDLTTTNTDIIPASPTINIGSPSARWNELHIDKIFLGGSATAFVPLTGSFVSDTGDTMTGALWLSSDQMSVTEPIIGADALRATTKGYVASNFLSKTDTTSQSLNSSLTLNTGKVLYLASDQMTAGSTNTLRAATQAYVDTKLNIAGGTMTGELLLPALTSTSPSSSAVTKSYVDSMALWTIAGPYNTNQSISPSNNTRYRMSHTNVTTPLTFTIQASSAQYFHIVCINTGKVKILPGAGVTLINTATGNTISSTGAIGRVLTFLYVGANTWDVVGDLM